MNQQKRIKDTKIAELNRDVEVWWLLVNNEKRAHEAPAIMKGRRIQERAIRILLNHA